MSATITSVMPTINAGIAIASPRFAPSATSRWAGRRHGAL
jgi:hypothetical protein